MRFKILCFLMIDDAQFLEAIYYRPTLLEAQTEARYYVQSHDGHNLAEITDTTNGDKWTVDHLGYCVFTKLQRKLDLFA